MSRNDKTITCLFGVIAVLCFSIMILLTMGISAAHAQEPDENEIIAEEPGPATDEIIIELPADLSVIEDKLTEVVISLGVVVGVLLVMAFSGGMRNAS